MPDTGSTLTPVFPPLGRSLFATAPLSQQEVVMPGTQGVQMQRSLGVRAPSIPFTLRSLSLTGFPAAAAGGDSVPAFGCAIAGGHRRFLTPAPSRSVVVPRVADGFRGVQLPGAPGRLLGVSAAWRAPAAGGVAAGESSYVGIRRLRPQSSRAVGSTRAASLTAVPFPGAAGRAVDVPGEQEEAGEGAAAVPDLAEVTQGLPAPRPPQGLEFSMFRPLNMAMRTINAFRRDAAVPGGVQTLSRRPLRGIVFRREDMR